MVLGELNNGVFEKKKGKLYLPIKLPSFQSDFFN